MFTANAIPSIKPRRLAWVACTALGSVLALLAFDVPGVPALATGLVAVIEDAGGTDRVLRND
jgi:hypothetical protein